jgi:uncharacterized protein (DUF302 family)
MAADGLITLRSNYAPKETMNRLETEVKAKGLTVFARIDHAAGAADVGLSLRPTDLLIFGNAKGGTPLMQSVQTIGIDLPLKMLIWQDEAGDTWLSYNDPNWIAKRHGANRNVEATITALTGVPSENSIQLTRDWRIRTSSPHDRNRPPVPPHAMRLFQAATAAGSRDPGTAASTQCPAAARATATAFALARSCSIHFALSSLPSHP